MIQSTGESEHRITFPGGKSSQQWHDLIGISLRSIPEGYALKK